MQWKPFGSHLLDASGSPRAHSAGYAGLFTPFRLRPALTFAFAGRTTIPVRMKFYCWGKQKQETFDRSPTLVVLYGLFQDRGEEKKQLAMTERVYSLPRGRIQDKVFPYREFV